MSGGDSLPPAQDKPIDSDALLVERAAAGDHKAFELLVIKYQRRIQRLENELTSSETPEAVLASKEIAQIINAAMEALPEELREAITLREIEGLSYEEISEAMDCPIGTVRSRIFRAREAISAKIKPLLENQSGKRW